MPSSVLSVRVPEVLRAVRHGGVPGCRGAFAYQVTTSVSGSRRFAWPPGVRRGGHGRPVCEEGARRPGRRRGPPGAAGGGALSVPDVAVKSV